jgi:hypothetical protein
MNQPPHTVDESLRKPSTHFGQRWTQAITWALLFTATVAAALWVFLYYLWTPDRWPSVEPIPKQAEAIDPVQLANGVIVHAHAAVCCVVREPQNTWSNLMFVFVGALIAGYFRQPLLYGPALALVGVGLGSFLYHASASLLLRAVDVGAMLWLYGQMAVLCAIIFFPRLAPWCKRYSALITASIFVVCVLVTLNRIMHVLNFRLPGISTMTIGIAILVGTAFNWEALCARDWHKLAWPAASFALFALAAAFQIGDRPNGWYCNPHNTIQGHAVWHIFSGIACGVAVWGLASSAAVSSDFYSYTPLKTIGRTH